MKIVIIAAVVAITIGIAAIIVTVFDKGGESESSSQTTEMSFTNNELI